MCVVSLVMEYGEEIERRKPEFYLIPENVRQLQDLFEQAKKFDDATGQPNCERPEKEAFFERVKLRAAAAEAARKAGVPDGEIASFVLGAEWHASEERAR